MVPALSLPLIDAIETADWVERDSERAVSRQVRLAEELVAASLDEYGHICALDRQSPGSEPEPFDERVSEILRKGYDQWATQAALLSRLQALKPGGQEIRRFRDLKLAVGMTRAMLRMTPELIQKGMEQVRNGQVHSLEEVRRELRDRRGD